MAFLVLVWIVLPVTAQQHDCFPCPADDEAHGVDWKGWGRHSIRCNVGVPTYKLVEWPSGPGMLRSTA